jgi:hypothetical protein
MGFKNWFTRKTTANRPNVITMAKTRRMGSVAAREQVRKANNKSGANGKMLASYNKASANVQKGRENAAGRASAALKRVNEAIERRKSGSKNSYKNALNAIEDEADKIATNELNEKVKDLRDQFDAATKKIVDDYIEDIEKQAREFSKHTDTNTVEKLKAALIKIIAEGDMNPTSDPLIKKILVFMLPLFLMAAPYMSKIFKKFKYNPGDPAYNRLAAFVDTTKSRANNTNTRRSNGMSGGNPEQYNKGKNVYMSGTAWTALSANMLSINLIVGGDSFSGEPNPILIFVLFIMAFYLALVIGVNVGIFAFNVLVAIKRAIFDDVKQAQATGTVSKELQRAAPQVAYAVVQQNPLHSVAPTTVSGKRQYSQEEYDKLPYAQQKFLIPHPTNARGTRFYYTES